MADIIPIHRKQVSSPADPILRLYADCGITVLPGDRRRIEDALTGRDGDPGIIILGSNVVDLNARRVD